MKQVFELPEEKSIEIEWTGKVYSPAMSSVDTIVLANMCIKETGATSVVDVGCGSGKIGLALKLLNPLVDVYLSDSDDRALKCTRKNALRLKLQVITLKADLLPKTQSFPVIVCNLPSYDKEQLKSAPEGLSKAYLADEDDGLYLYKKILPQVPVGGFFICEIQEKLQKEFIELIKEKFTIITRTDFAFALFRHPLV